MLLTVLSTFIMFLFQTYSNATPNAAPGATPYPDTVTDPLPYWFWYVTIPVVVLGAFGVYKIVKSARAIPGEGYIEYANDGIVIVPKDTESK